jgi:hypothetical protein
MFFFGFSKMNPFLLRHNYIAELVTLIKETAPQEWQPNQADDRGINGALGLKHPHKGCN